MLVLVGRFCLDVHIKESWDSTGVCVKYHPLCSSFPASDVLNELGRFPYYLYAVMIVKDSVIYILMEKDTLIVCSLIWSSTVVYWEENKGSISGGSLPNHIELD